MNVAVPQSKPESLSELSVLVSCYNKSQFIPKFLSQANQLLSAGAEVVVIDDGSTDDSFSQLIAYQPPVNTPQWKLISQKNQGSAATRNRLISESTKPWFLFLDIDDFIVVRMVATTLHLSIEKHADMAICNYSISGTEITGPMPIKVQSPSLFDISDIKDGIFAAMGYWRYLYKRSTIARSEIKFFPTKKDLSNKYFILDDAFWLIQLQSLNGKVLVFPENEVMYEWYVTPNTIASLQNYRRQQALLPVSALLFLRRQNKNYWRANPWQIESLINMLANSSRELPWNLWLRSHYHRVMFAVKVMNLLRGGRLRTAYILTLKSGIRPLCNASNKVIRSLSRIGLRDVKRK